MSFLNTMTNYKLTKICKLKFNLLKDREPVPYHSSSDDKNLEFAYMIKLEYKQYDTIMFEFEYEMNDIVKNVYKLTCNEFVFEKLEDGICTLNPMVIYRVFVDNQLKDYRCYIVKFIKIRIPYVLLKFKFIIDKNNNAFYAAVYYNLNNNRNLVLPKEVNNKLVELRNKIEELSVLDGFFQIKR